MNNVNIVKIVKKTAQKLFAMNSGINMLKKNEFKLIFPSYSNGIKRVSEQELRQCFIEALENKIYYSVETPTVEKYTFSGKGHISGCADLSLHKKINDEKFCITSFCEFKAHNVDEKKCTKDFEKLFREKGENYFIHLLESCDNGTLKALINKKYKNGLIDVIKKCNENIDNKEYNYKVKAKSLNLYIISLNPKFVINKTIKPKELYSKKLEKVENFEIDYSIINSEFSLKNNNWKKVNYLI
ncbi:MAG: hypothetical protein KBE73_03405 [Fusobacteriaceae bacterium]|nr:hypothetical protein [Fusobacteriaceae bacterium]